MSSGSGESYKVKFLSAAANICAIISTIPFIITLIGYASTSNILFLLLSALSLGCLILIITLRKAIAKRFLVSFMNWSAPDKSCMIIKKKIVYEYLQIDKMRFENEFSLLPLHDGLESFNDKLKWSGSGETILSPIFPEHKIEFLDDSTGLQKYQINFGGKCYNKKDGPLHTGIKIENLDDSERKAYPLLSTGIYDITKSITLQLIFPLELNPVNIRKLEYIHYTDDQHYRCVRQEQAIFDQKTKKRVIEWEIKNPIYGGKYQIDWSFA